MGFPACGFVVHLFITWFSVSPVVLGMQELQMMLGQEPCGHGALGITVVTSH